MPLQVKPALDAIRALGPVLEDHLQLLLPALNRLIAPGASSLPLPIQEETLATMQVCVCVGGGGGGGGGGEAHA